MAGRAASGRHQFVVAMTADMPVKLMILAYARLARMRFGLEYPMVLEVDRRGLDILAELIDTARRELDSPSRDSSTSTAELDEVADTEFPD